VKNFVLGALQTFWTLGVLWPFWSRDTECL